MSEEKKDPRSDADEPAFDAVAALAELEAAMGQSADEPARDNEGIDRYIASLEEDVLQATALVEQLQRQVRQAEERADRAQQEVERAKGRLEKEAQVTLQRRQRKLLEAFLQVFDDLERALDSARQVDHNPEVIAGVELVQRSFLKTLGDLGVQRQQPLGQPFDPALHQGVSTLPAPSPEQKGQVLEVVRPGYQLADGTVLRPASVVVGG